MEKILFSTSSNFTSKSLIQIKKSYIKKKLILLKRMTDIMLKAPGVGLAANQIGILKTNYYCEYS